MTMTRGGNETTADRGDAIRILHMPPELDLATADGLAEQGSAAIAGHARLLLLDLAGLCFCDARGLSAFVRIANHADAAGCRYGLIASPPPVAKLLRITGLNKRLPVFETIDDALAHHTAHADDLRAIEQRETQIAVPCEAPAKLLRAPAAAGDPARIQTL